MSIVRRWWALGSEDDHVVVAWTLGMIFGGLVITILRGAS